MADLRIPNQSDGDERYVTPPVGFLRINNRKGGYIDNGSECSTKDTDADFTAFGGANLMGDGSTQWYPVSTADYFAHINGTNGVWLQWEEVKGYCHVKQRFAYPVGTVLTEAQYNQTVRWAHRYTSSCGAGVIPFWESLVDDEGNELVDDVGNVLGYYL